MTSDGPLLDLSVLEREVLGPSNEKDGGPQTPPSSTVAQDSPTPSASVENEPASGAEPALEYVVENPELSLSFAEAIQLGAVDSVFFNQLWFPKTFRQAPALFHPEIYSILDNAVNRYINIQICRDGAKTTILRAYSAKRIAYGLSRTILYVAISEPKAKQSVGWLKHQIETNTKFCEAFGLSQGKPWSDEHICILHGPEQHKVHVIAFGINAGVRGVNLEDFRPDLIIIDDVVDDENSKTKEQRDKIEDRVLGALKESLSPRSETPDAKMVLLNTPQDFEDVSEKAKKDAQFVSAAYGCWTKETEGLAIEDQESSWPARYPSDELRGEKRAAIARNKYSVFAREKECTLVTAEECAFKSEWIQFFGQGEKEPEPPKHEGVVYYAIDPVPPPSQAALDKGLKKKDYESHSIVLKWQGKFYLLEQQSNRGHDPEWTISVFFELCLRYNPRKVLVEAVAYQRVLAWILKKAMQTARRYWMIEAFDDKRQKYKRIVDGLNGPLSHGQVYLRRKHTSVISQLNHYPGKNPEGNYDDDIESLAVAVGALNTGYIGVVGDDHYKQDEIEYEELEYLGAP